MHINVENLRVLVEPASKDLTREKCKEVYLERLHKEFEMVKELIEMKLPPEQEGPFMLINRTKIMD